MKILLLLVSCFLCPSLWAESHIQTCPKELDVQIRLLHSKKTANPCDFIKNSKEVLFVNTASHCGYTKQFSGLEALYNKYKDKGLVVLGFPSDSFKQEEKEEEATARVCYENYGVSFPMFSHVKVKGDQANSVFAFLATKTESPSWNFNKYLMVNGETTHYGSKITPLDSNLEKDIVAGLKL